MNGTEQRRQATVAERVERHVSDVTEVLDRFDARLFDVASKGQETRRELNELRMRVASVEGHVNGLSGRCEASERRLVGTAKDVELNFLEFQQFRQGIWDRERSLSTFWGRLCWLFTGR